MEAFAAVIYSSSLVPLRPLEESPKWGARATGYKQDASLGWRKKLLQLLFTFYIRLYLLLMLPFCFFFYNVLNTFGTLFWWYT